MYRLKNDPMKTVSAGRMPIAHMTRACSLAMTRQSARETPNAVGRPVVPDVPWMRWTSDSSTQA